MEFPRPYRGYSHGGVIPVLPRPLALGDQCQAKGRGRAKVRGIGSRHKGLGRLRGEESKKCVCIYITHILDIYIYININIYIYININIYI